MLVTTYQYQRPATFECETCNAIDKVYTRGPVPTVCKCCRKEAKNKYFRIPTRYICEVCGKAGSGQRGPFGTRCPEHAIRRYKPKPKRSYLCETCGASHEFSTRGTLPRFCPTCSLFRDRRQQQWSICLHCAKEFQRKEHCTRKFFCSSECYEKYRSPIVINTCRTCGEHFGGHAGKRYCSAECHRQFEYFKRTANRQMPQVRFCQFCSSPFTSDHGHQMYCTRACADKMHALRSDDPLFKVRAKAYRLTRIEKARQSGRLQRQKQNTAYKILRQLLDQQTCTQLGITKRWRRNYMSLHLLQHLIGKEKTNDILKHSN